MRLVFAGTPEVALPSLAAIEASRHDLLAVLTRPPARSGRGRQVAASPAAQWAYERGLEVLTPARPAEKSFVDRLGELGADCVPVVAYGALIPLAALVIPSHGWVNLHFSLLPAWRGAAPVQHALLRGDELTGACVFRLAEDLDTGPIYGRLVEPIGGRDTAGELLERLASAGARLLIEVLDAIEDGAARAVPQPADGVSYAPKVTVDDARVRWAEPAFAVDRRIRACTPTPGAWSVFRDERVKFGPVLPVPDKSARAPGEAASAPDEAARAPDDVPLAPGEVLVAQGTHPQAVLVGTGTGPVRLGEVRPAGRRAMPAADWARGARIKAGECLD